MQQALAGLKKTAPCDRGSVGLFGSATGTGCDEDTSPEKTETQGKPKAKPESAGGDKGRREKPSQGRPVRGSTARAAPTARGNCRKPAWPALRIGSHLPQSEEPAFRAQRCRLRQRVGRPSKNRRLKGCAGPSAFTGRASSTQRSKPARSLPGGRAVRTRARSPRAESA